MLQVSRATLAHLTRCKPSPSRRYHLQRVLLPHHCRTRLARRALPGRLRAAQRLKQFPLQPCVQTLCTHCLPTETHRCRRLWAARAP